MPEISRFLGIVIYMYHREHGPAHFHAKYGEFEITVEIASGRVTGRCPARVRRLVGEWAEKHRGELMANWKLARRYEDLRRVPPLERR